MRDTPRARRPARPRSVLPGLALFVAGTSRCSSHSSGFAVGRAPSGSAGTRRCRSARRTSSSVPWCWRSPGCSARIGFGTVANALPVGSLVQLLMSLGFVDGLSDDPLGVRIALLAGIGLMGVGTALYPARARRRAARLADGGLAQRGAHPHRRGAQSRTPCSLGDRARRHVRRRHDRLAIGIGSSVELAVWLHPLALGSELDCAGFRFRPLRSRRCRRPSKRPTTAGCSRSSRSVRRGGSNRRARLLRRTR